MGDFYKIAKKTRGLTIIEILVILAIIIFLLSSIFVFLKPHKLFLNIRDNIRKTDLINFANIINISYNDLGRNLFKDRPENLVNKVFLSLPLEDCRNLTSEVQIVCVSNPSDPNNPWLPINIGGISSLNKFKVDPINKGDYFYGFQLLDPIKLKYRFFSKLESTGEYFIVEGEIGDISYNSFTTSTGPIAISNPSGPGDQTASGTPPSSGVSTSTFVKGIESYLNVLLPVKVFPKSDRLEIWTGAPAAVPESFLGSNFIINIDYNGNLIYPYIEIKQPSGANFWFEVRDVLSENTGYLSVMTIWGNVTTTICNETNNCSYSPSNILLVKLDINKNVVWAKTIGNGVTPNYIPIYCDFGYGQELCGYDSRSADILYNENINKIIKTIDGYLLIGNLGVTYYYPLKDPRESYSYEYLLFMKVDSNGNVQWAKTIKFPGYEETNASYLTFSDGIKIGNYYYLSGVFSDTQNKTWPYPFHARDGLIAKIDENGNIIWIKMYKLSGGVDDFNKIIQMSDGNLLTTGVCAPLYSYDPCITKIDQDGNLLKSVVIYPASPGVINGGEGGHDLILTSDGNYAIIAGGASGAVVFSKFNNNLDLINSSVFRIGEDQWTNRLVEINNGYMVIGEFNNAAPYECVIGPGGTSGLYIAKLDEYGKLNYCGCFGTQVGTSTITNNVTVYTRTFEVNDYSINVASFSGIVRNEKTDFTTQKYCGN